MTSKEENKTKGMLTKKDLDRMAWRSMTYDYCWHYERAGNMGYSTMIGGVLKKIYKGQPEKYKEALKRNLEVFNITAMFAPFVGGVAASMEEQNAKTEGFDTGAISAIIRSVPRKIESPIPDNGPIKAVLIALIAPVSKDRKSVV